MSVRMHRRTILPIIVFPILTLLSIKLIITHLFTFEPALRAQCSQGSPNASSIPYTGVQALDSQLCFMVAFFHSALDHPFASDFMAYFIGSSSIYIIFPCLEAIRLSKTPPRSVWARMLGYPEGWLALSQAASLGVTMTLYGLVFVLALTSTPSDLASRPASTGAKEGQDLQLKRLGQVSGIDAQAVGVATVLGAAVPSLALFAYRDPSVTVIWQAFPLYIYLARMGYQRFVANRSNPSSTAHQTEHGSKSVRLTLLSSIALSAYFHISFAFSVLTRHDLASFLNGSPNFRDDDALALNVLVFLLWDFVFTSISALLTLGFDAIGAGTKVWESTLVVFGCILGCVLVGPGAVVAVCVLRREERLGGLKVKRGTRGLDTR